VSHGGRSADMMAEGRPDLVFWPKTAAWQQKCDKANSRGMVQNPTVSPLCQSFLTNGIPQTLQNFNMKCAIQCAIIIHLPSLLSKHWSYFYHSLRMLAYCCTCHLLVILHHFKISFTSCTQQILKKCICITHT
jgi:hypothetical protein